MKCLILSSNTGEGHNSCAKAIKEYFDAQGDPCTIKDSLAFISESASAVISQGHTKLYRHMPGLWKAGYAFSERHEALFQERSGIYRFLSLGSERMYRYIRDCGYDTVICPHMFSALMLTDVLRRHPMDLRTAFVATDHTCSPSVKDSCLQTYFIPTPDLTEEFLCQNITQEKIIPCGIPVRQMFYKIAEKTEAKTQFGIPPKAPHLLMMCGSMGCGPISKIALRLAHWMPEDWHLTIVCGTNKGLYRQLSRQYGQQKNFHIQGFVRDMSTLMDSADLYLTKPGGISVTEASLKNLPMVFIDAVAGCETSNRLHYLNAGGARTADTPKDLAKVCLDLLASQEKRTEMSAALARLPKENAPQVIHETMKA